MSASSPITSRTWVLVGVVQLVNIAGVAWATIQQSRLTAELTSGMAVTHGVPHSSAPVEADTSPSVSDPLRVAGLLKQDSEVSSSTSEQPEPSEPEDLLPTDWAPRAILPPEPNEQTRPLWVGVDADATRFPPEPAVDAPRAADMSVRLPVGFAAAEPPLEVQLPAVEPPPAEVVDASPQLPESRLLRPVVRNAHTSTRPVRFLVNGQYRELQPGESAELDGGDTWLIEFHRGRKYGAARHVVYDGVHVFSVGKQGWELAPVEPPARR